MNFNTMKKFSIGLMLVIISTSCIGVNREFKNIRSQILNNLDDDFDRQIEFSVGPVGFFVASQFVKFADTEENVDEILSKVKNIHVGIYDRLTNYSIPSLTLLKNITNSIVDENWKSIVKSIDGNEMIGVFVKEINSDEIEELFVVTLSNEELVLIKLQGKLGSIIEVIIRDHGHNLRIAEKS